MGDVNDLGIGHNIKNDPFHDTDKRVVQAEVGGKGDYWTHPVT